MKIGDGVLFYHSNANPPAVMGTAKIVREAYPDPEQFKPESKYFDEKSDRKNPRWVQVDIALEEKFHEPVTLEKIKKTKSLSEMLLVKKGTRLSIQPVNEAQWKTIVQLGRK